MVAVSVLDTDSQFRGIFEEICNSLQIKSWPLSRVNHKQKSVENYHRFLNKTQAIAGQDFGNNDIFIQNAKHHSMHGTAPQ